MKWNSDLYDDKHSFVAKYGKYLIDLADVKPGQAILDLGCGTGLLTDELSNRGAVVMGVDVSAEMIAKARSKYPHLRFQMIDATDLPFDNCFDTVFSNAVFHWIQAQEKLLRSIHGALKNDGKLVCEFGAKNNTRRVQTAFAQILQQMGHPYHSKFFYPSREEYRLLLEQAGFKVLHIIEFDRPTPLTNNKAGLRNWISQFLAEDLSDFTDSQKEYLFTEVESLCRTDLWKDDQWVVDYRRLQAVAIKVR